MNYITKGVGGDTKLPQEDCINLSTVKYILDNIQRPYSKVQPSPKNYLKNLNLIGNFYLINLRKLALQVCNNTSYII